MNESSRVESCSRNVDSRSRRNAGGRIMSSVAAAHQLTRSLGDLLAPSEPAKVKLDRLYREMTKRLPSVTRRRVRALFFAEVARVDYEEMRALEELRAEQELRRAKHKLATTAKLLAAHLAAEGAPLDGHQMRALGRIAGAVDISRAVGDAA